MEKKKITILSWGLTIFAAACGLTAFCMIFVRAINTPHFLAENFSGLQVALGCSTKSNATIFSPSAGLILAFFLPLIGICAAVIGKGYKIVTFLSAAFLVTGGVLALCATLLLNPAVTNLTEVTIAAGPIASGVLSIVGGATLCASAFIKG